MLLCHERTIYWTLPSWPPLHRALSLPHSSCPEMALTWNRGVTPTRPLGCLSTGVHGQTTSWGVTRKASQKELSDLKNLVSDPGMEQILMQTMVTKVLWSMDTTDHPCTRRQKLLDSEYQCTSGNRGPLPKSRHPSRLCECLSLHVRRSTTTPVLLKRHRPR
jgi:hypothetical protein